MRAEQMRQNQCTPRIRYVVAVRHRLLQARRGKDLGAEAKTAGSRSFGGELVVTTMPILRGELSRRWRA
jgi:hypothetical protein